MKIDKHSFEVPVFVTHLDQHEELKRDLKELLDSLAAREITVKGSPIAKSSYGQGKLNQQWRPLFLKTAMPHLQELYNDLKTPEWEIRQMWFQTYEKGNLHRAHTHGGYTWANVYFLDLPNPELATAFYHPARHWVELRGHPKTDSPPVLRPPIREGDIVTFPGYLEHEAPLVAGDDTKTIISFNVLASTTPTDSGQRVKQ